MIFFNFGDGWASLERSLPVVNWDFNGFLSFSGDDWGSLERSLPVVKWDFNRFLSGLGVLRTLTTGSELGFQWISFRIGAP